MPSDLQPCSHGFSGFRPPAADCGCPMQFWEVTTAMWSLALLDALTAEAWNKLLAAFLRALASETGKQPVTAADFRERAPLWRNVWPLAQCLASHLCLLVYMPNLRLASQADAALCAQTKRGLSMAAGSCAPLLAELRALFTLGLPVLAC